MTNVLVVTTTVRVLDGIHRNTTNTGPAVSLGFVFVVCVTCLQQGFIGTTTTGNDTNHGTSNRWDQLLLSRWKTDSGFTSVSIVSNDGGVVSRSSGECAT